MPGLLLDTHALIWLLAGEPVESRALFEVARAQSEKSLYVSVISAWEVGVAALKTNSAKRPNLRGLAPDRWFQHGVRAVAAKTIPVTFRIAVEAANVPELLGYGDPGDGFLVATAHSLGLTLVTRDEKIAALAGRRPDYLHIQRC